MIVGIDNEAASVSGQHFDFQFGDHDFRRVEVNLPGAFQFNNAAIAVTLFLLWLQREQPRRLPTGSSRNTRRTARGALARPLEVIQQDPLTVIDVGHTPDGIRQSLASLLAIHGRRRLDPRHRRLARQKGRRDHRRAGAFIRHHHLHSSASQGGRGKVIAPAARRTQSQANIHVAATIADAARLSQEMARRQRRSVYVAGGLFLAVEYATVAKGGRAEDLGFSERGAQSAQSNGSSAVCIRKRRNTTTLGENVMSDTVNRQILLVEKPTGNSDLSISR